MTVQLIRQTAKELAGAFYEEDHSDRFRKFWPTAKSFIGRCWPNFVTMARTLLTSMLTRNDVPQHQKDDIYDALIEDQRRAADKPSARPGIGALKANPHHPGAMEKKLFH